MGERGTGIERRQVLRGTLVAGTVWGMLGGSARAATDPFQGFMALSQELTGFQDLDERVGRRIYELLEGAGRLGAMRSAVDGEPEALEVEILAAWYSGLVDTPDGPKLVAYEDALAWRSLYFTPPGECNGAFGAWAEAPEEN